MPKNWTQWTDRSLHMKRVLHAFIYALQTERSDGERITRLRRTIVDWKEEVISSNVSLWRNRRGVLHSAGQGGRDCVTTRQRGKDGLPVTRKPHKGKKSSISPAKCAPGREGGSEAGREGAEERWKVMNWQYLCWAADLQQPSGERELCHAYFYSQFKQIAAMFQSLTSSCCSSARGQGCGCCIISVSITPG